MAAEGVKKQKRVIPVTTFNKWQLQCDKEFSTLSWLRCDKDSTSSFVETLWCVVCRKYETSIQGMKNFSRSWIVGSTNQRISNITDHGKTEQHNAAMTRYRIEQAKSASVPITTYSPIVRSLLTMDKSTLEKMERKFDICYLLVKEGMAFKKYSALYSLEERHGVELGNAYKTKDSARVFTNYIAQHQRNSFMATFSKAHFFSFLMDGSTDAGNVEDEVFVLIHCFKDDKSEVICSHARFFSVQVPKKADADGLIACLGSVLQEIGISNVLDKSCVLESDDKPILVGGGTDGASVNIGRQNGMKAKLEKHLPWLFWAWCYGHCLELACKDALTSNLFQNVSEMLLRLYLIYSKSPKKTRELCDIVIDLKEVFEIPEGGDIPVRAQGTRWIAHKRKAMQRVVDRFGAYVNHLTTLSVDTSINSTDRARLKGYLHKWQQSSILIGCALYVDVLKSPSFLSLSLQKENLDVVMALQHILRSVKHLKALAESCPDEWPTIKLVLSKITSDEEANSVYQGAILKSFTPSIVCSCQDQALHDLLRLDQMMRSRLEWSDIKLLRSILVFIDTQSWVRNGNDMGSSLIDLSSSDTELEPDDSTMASIYDAVDYITSSFKEPLEKQGVGLLALRDEIEEVVCYSRKYFALQKENYQKIWFKLYTTPDAKKWPNVLLLCELIFSLPFSNGIVERIFSILKVIKTEKRTNLSVDSLRDLLEIKVEGPAFDDFIPRPAVELWWKDCKTTRRPSQLPRKEYRPRASTGEPSRATDSAESEHTSDDTTMFSLDEWDSWFKDNIDLESTVTNESM